MYRNTLDNIYFTQGVERWKRERDEITIAVLFFSLLLYTLLHTILADTFYPYLLDEHALKYKTCSLTNTHTTDIRTHRHSTGWFSSQMRERLLVQYTVCLGNARANVVIGFIFLRAHAFLGWFSFPPSLHLLIGRVGYPFPSPTNSPNSFLFRCCYFNTEVSIYSSRLSLPFAKQASSPELGVRKQKTWPNFSLYYRASKYVYWGILWSIESTHFEAL